MAGCRAFGFRGVVMSAALVSLALTSACSERSTREPQQARQDVVDLIGKSTAAVDGDWKLLEGPAISSCHDPDGGHGAWYQYVKQLPNSRDREHDIQSLRALWEGLGLTVGGYRGGGTDPDVGLIGRGEHGSLIQLTVVPGFYTLWATSECMDRDPDPLRSHAPLFPDDE